MDYKERGLHMRRLSHGDDPIADVLWGLVLDGREDDSIGEPEFGNYWLFLSIDPTEWPALFDIADVPYDPSIVPTSKAHYILYQSESGILDYEEFSSKEDAFKQWDEIRDAYEEWLANLQ
jgi:hypothetical protein